MECRLGSLKDPSFATTLLKTRGRADFPMQTSKKTKTMEGSMFIGISSSSACSFERDAGPQQAPLQAYVKSEPSESATTGLAELTCKAPVPGGAPAHSVPEDGQLQLSTHAWPIPMVKHEGDVHASIPTFYAAADLDLHAGVTKDPHARQPGAQRFMEHNPMATDTASCMQDLDHQQQQNASAAESLPGCAITTGAQLSSSKSKQEHYCEPGPARYMGIEMMGVQLPPAKGNRAAASTASLSDKGVAGQKEQGWWACLRHSISNFLLGPYHTQEEAAVASDKLQLCLLGKSEALALNFPERGYTKEVCPD